MMTTDYEPRQFDARVAHEVFGQEIVWQDGEPVWHDPDYPEDRSIWIICPHYFTRIEAAWRIVTHLQEQGWSFRMGDFRDGEGRLCWSAFFQRDRGIVVQEAFGETVMEAICRVGLEVAKVDTR